MSDKTYKILIIEDEEPISEVLSERLKNEGFVTVVAADGEQGLAMALEQKPDVILLDILMPKKGGLSMLQELRATEAGKNIPVMMLTNLSGTEDVNKALENGAFDYMVKSDWDIANVGNSIRSKLEGTK
ncbi:hypothetical protein BH23PAT1_BH23PAT1_4060 [soil metagenome]